MAHPDPHRESRPLFSISLVEPSGTAVSEIPPTPDDAHFRIEFIPQGKAGHDLSDHTVLVVPMDIDALGWIGLNYPGATLRPDGNLTVVFIKGKGKVSTPRDVLENAIRNQLNEMGIDGDNISFVDDNFSDLRDAFREGSCLVEKLNQIGKPRETGFQAPYVAELNRGPFPLPLKLDIRDADPCVWGLVARVGTIERSSAFVIPRMTPRKARISAIFCDPPAAFASRTVDTTGRFEERDTLIPLPYSQMRQCKWLYSPAAVLTNTLYLRLIHTWSKSGSQDVVRSGRRYSLHVPLAPQSTRCRIVRAAEVAGRREFLVSTPQEFALFPGPVYLVDEDAGVLLRTEQALPPQLTLPGILHSDERAA